MKSKSIIMSLIFIILLMVSACSESLTTEEIQQKLIQANTELDSYSFDMIMDMRMEMDLLGESMEMTTRMDSTGQIDIKGQNMVLIGTMNLVGAGLNTDMEIQTYIVDNYVYTQTFGVWLKSALEQNAWDQ